MRPALPTIVPTKEKTMLRKKLLGVVICLTLLGSAPVAANDKYGTKEEAQALCEKAAEILKADKKKALEAFQDKNGEFFSKDLYVFVNDKEGVFIAHGTKPALVGKSGLAMKDANGFEFVKAFLEVKDKGWVDYKWGDPTDNNKVKDKSSYIIRVGDDIVGVGYYKNQ